MFARLLQVRRGERTRTFLLFLYLFLIVTSYVVTKATRDALFLTRYSAARLPLADMASALAVGLAMSIYLRADRSTAVRSMIIRTLFLFAATSVVFWWLSHTSEPRWMLPLLYVWASVFGVLLPAQVWTLANFVMTTRDAKRLFGVVGGGAICGWIVGGAVTKTLARAYGTSSLLLMTAAALGICPLLVTLIWRNRRKNSGDEHSLDAPVTDEREPPAGILETGRLIWGSPSLRTIAGIIAISSLVTTIAAWQFRAIARQSFADTDALTAFFGTFNIWAGLLSLAAQIFIVPRLLRRWGIGVALLVVPATLALGSVGVLLSGTLWSVVLLKGGDQVLRYSIDRSTVELLYLPVPLHQIGRVKPFIDTLIWRLGDWIGSLIVLVAVSLLSVTPSEISVVTIVLLAAWVMAAVRATDGYVANLRQSIYGHRMDRERLSETMDRSTSEVVASALRSDDPANILYALGLLADREIPISLEAMRPLVDHGSPEVRKRAIAALAAAHDALAVPAVERRLHDEEPGVRAAALLYLTRVTDVDPLERLDTLQDVDGSIVASAIAWYLSRQGRAQKIDAVRLLIDGVLQRPDADGEAARREAAALIPTLPEGFIGELSVLLRDPSEDVARLALRSAAALGAEAVPALRAALADHTRPSRFRSEVPDILQRIGTADAEQLLVEYLLDRDPLVRLRVVSALNKVRQLHPQRHLERELLETVLAAEILGHYRSYQLLGKAEDLSDPPTAAALQHDLERIFRLMKLLFPNHDFHSVYVGLKSENAAIRDNALEFLEHALPPQICRVLLPLIDSDVSVTERIRLADTIIGAPALELESDALLQRAAQDAAQKLAVHS